MINAFSFCRANDKVLRLNALFITLPNQLMRVKEYLMMIFFVNAHSFCDYLVNGKAYLNCNIFLLEISAYYILLVNK